MSRHRKIVFFFCWFGWRLYRHPATLNTLIIFKNPSLPLVCARVTTPATHGSARDENKQQDGNSGSFFCGLGRLSLSHLAQLKPLPRAHTVREGRANVITQLSTSNLQPVSRSQTNLNCHHILYFQTRTSCFFCSCPVQENMASSSRSRHSCYSVLR